jgi:hypothetical protein
MPRLAIVPTMFGSEVPNLLVPSRGVWGQPPLARMTRLTRDSDRALEEIPGTVQPDKSQLTTQKLGELHPPLESEKERKKRSHQTRRRLERH